MRSRSDKDQAEADRAAIEDLHRRDAATLAYDVDTLASILDEDVVALAPKSRPTRGRVARAGMEKGRAASQQLEPIEYRQEWCDLILTGDYAFEWGVFHSAVRPKTGGDVIRNIYHVLRVLKRSSEGEWKVFRTMWNDAPTSQTR